MSNFKAFTLAEVLITLGIIGIVAAMTMPTLIGKYRDQERSARIKKFYSGLQQAILLSENDNGEIKDWIKGTGSTISGNESQNLSVDAKICKEFFNKYLKPYMKDIKSDNPSQQYEHAINFQIWLNDGSTILMHNGYCFDFVFDVNGDNKPNKQGYDQFTFLLCVGSEGAVNTGKIMCGKKIFCAYNLNANLYNTREKVLEACQDDTKRAICTYLLQLDNWEFKNDYPYKY